MFRPYMWAIFRLRSNFSEVAIQECGVFLGIGGWVEGGEEGTRSLSPSRHPTPTSPTHLV